jgi:hypothetical protein
LDHQPPLALHFHVEGSGCCRVLPACGDCQRRQGAELGFGGHWTAPQPELPEVDEHEPCPGPADSYWDAAPWLDPWRELPKVATWPRYMTGPHPEAVGSYGPDAIGWLAEVAGLTLRWWQQLVLVRQLEHDRDGQLCWIDVLQSTARQSGKSTGLRACSTWRLHQAPLFAEPQTILHTGKDLPVCKEVQRPAMAWALARGYPVRQQNGNEQIEHELTGSRWIIRGKGSVYGYPASLVLADEAWGIPTDVVDDGLEPTMAERTSPQLILASTAHRKATALFPTRRQAALDQLDEPAGTLLLEWSAPRGVDLDDRDAWRQASPHWSAGRARLLESRLRRVEAGQSLDPDEDDPGESFRAQYLNQWPIRLGDGAGEPFLDPGLWARLLVEPESGGAGLPVCVGVEDNYGQGAAVAAACRIDGARFEVDGWLAPSWQQGIDDAQRLLDDRPGSKLILGASIAQISDLRPRPARASSTETRTGLALLRELARQGLVLHDHGAELEAQIEQARVRPVPSGGLALLSSRRADVLRAAAWALQMAHERQRRPAVH